MQFFKYVLKNRRFIHHNVYYFNITTYLYDSLFVQLHMVFVKKKNLLE